MNSMDKAAFERMAAQYIAGIAPERRATVLKILSAYSNAQHDTVEETHA